MSRFIRFTLFGKQRWGRVCEDGESIAPYAGDPFEPEAEEDPSTVPWHAVTLNPPVPVRSSKIIAVARNYRAHAAELDNPVPSEPLLFLKPPSSIIAHEQPIVFPTGSSECVHHEGELAVIIGRRAKHVSPDEALQHVLGYSLFNDVTARDVQRRDKAFTRGKGFDTFGPLGPWIDTDFVPVDQALSVRVNGGLRQRARLSDMIFDVATLIACVTSVMTLERYDVIATGTPAGVGPLVPGDVVEVSIEGLGVLENPVVAGSPPRETWGG